MRLVCRIVYIGQLLKGWDKDQLDKVNKAYRRINDADEPHGVRLFEMPLV